jgi:methionine-rich copper-binding protein CopC
MPRRPPIAPFTIAALLAAALVAAATPGLALAHADLASASPGSGATITPGPTTLVASFTEAIDPTKSSIEVRDASGSTVATGGADQVSADRLSMSVPLPALAVGTYEVRWTSTAAEDGHVERGMYQFTVAETAPASPGPGDAPATASPGASTAPSPSAATEGSGSSTSDLSTFIPIAVALVVVGAIAIVLVRRRPT